MSRGTDSSDENAGCGTTPASLADTIADLIERRIARQAAMHAAELLVRLAPLLQRAQALQLPRTGSADLSDRMLELEAIVVDLLQDEIDYLTQMTKAISDPS